MRYGLVMCFVLLLGADVPGSGQIYPGGYPGGGYPGGGYPGGGYPGGGYPGGGMGIPMPGGRRSRGQKQPTENITGMVRSLSSNDLELGTDDKRVLSVSVNNRTKYYLPNGDKGQPGDFAPGDHVGIDAIKDQNGYYYGTRITMVARGTAEDRAAASKPIDSGSSGSSSASSRDESSSGGSVEGDDDRPRLHRAPNSGSSAGDNSSSTQSTASVQRPAAADPDDSGPPVLRRGAASSNSAPDNSASDSSGSSGASRSRPSVAARDVNGVTEPPPPPQMASNSDSPMARTSLPQDTAGDQIVLQARQVAFEFSETLPNYVVKQYTTRYQSATASGNHTSWQALDTVSADVVSENGHERYKNIQINGHPTNQPIEKTGSWSEGEFSSMLQDVLHPATNADFFNKRSSTIASRSAWHYDFTVEQPNSHWTVEAESQSYKPAYKGSIWIDKQTFRVLRIEMQARNIPTSFPLDTVESTVDYDYVLIGEKKFLLPVHSEALSCVRGTSDCSRNTIDFRNYKKFEADTSITFDSDKPQ